MNLAAVDRACMVLPGVTMVVQWGGANVYKVGPKVFAIAPNDGGLTVKVSEIAYEILIETGRAQSAPYLARGGWAYFADLAPLDDAEVAGWLGSAHGMIAARLTRKQRADLGIG